MARALTGIAEAGKLLAQGGVVVYPTETFYGVGALASDPDAVARAARAKGRPDGKPLPLLAADLSQVEAVARMTPLGARLAALFWPGPLTLVLPADPSLPPEIGSAGTVGIRVPGSAAARELARAAGGALVSTSANLSGEPPVADPRRLSPELLARVDAVLDLGPTPGGAPSSVVDARGEAPASLREGAIPFEAVLRALAGGQTRR